MMNSRCTSSPSLSLGRSGWSTGVGSGWRGGTDAGTGGPWTAGGRGASVVAKARRWKGAGAMGSAISWSARVSVGLASGLCGPRAVVTVWYVMLGLSMYVFINVNGYGFRNVHRVAPSGAAFQPNMTSNPAIALRLQSTRPAGRVAELWSLGGITSQHL